MNIQRRQSGFIGFVAGMTVIIGGANPAAAQWGMGMGWGMFGVGPSPSTQLLNQHALTRAAAGGSRGPSRSPLSGNSNSYSNRLRDNGFVSHYDVARRAAPSYRSTPTAALECRAVTGAVRRRRPTGGNGHTAGELFRCLDEAHLAD